MTIQDHLYSQDESRREHAASSLSRCNSRAVVKQLLAALNDQNRYVAIRAAFGLSIMKPALVVPYLSKALLGQDPDRIKQAAWALGRIRNPKARRVLIAALENRRKIVRYQAAAGLWRYAHQLRSKKAEHLLTRMLDGDNGSAALTLRRMQRPSRAIKVRQPHATVFNRMGGDFIR